MVNVVRTITGTVTKVVPENAVVHVSTIRVIKTRSGIRVKKTTRYLARYASETAPEIGESVKIKSVKPLSKTLSHIVVEQDI